jgi:hypothetical protein
MEYVVPRPQGARSLSQMRLRGVLVTANRMAGTTHSASSTALLSAWRLTQLVYKVRNIVSDVLTPVLANTRHWLHTLGPGTAWSCSQRGTVGTHAWRCHRGCMRMRACNKRAEREARVPGGQRPRF